MHPVARPGFIARVVVYSFVARVFAHAEAEAAAAGRISAFVIALLPWAVGLLHATAYRQLKHVRQASLVDAAMCGTWLSLNDSPIVRLASGSVLLVATLSVGGVALSANAALVAALAAATYRAAVGAWLPPAYAQGIEVSSVALSSLYACGIAYSTFVQGQKINRHRGQLEERVADRTAALASTNAAIQRFVPREFLHALGHDDVTTTKLGDATAKSITVLFADIRNFTSSSEGMSPEETFAFLNGCLSKLGPHVRAQSGFVDKYIGDAIMALFPRDPSDAVRAAVAMQDELRRTNEGAGDRVPLAIGVGIHVGRVMMGTIGEAERFEATVISDAVNLTARLESLTKQLGCAVLVSEEVHAALGEDLRAHTRRLGTFLVKGKAQPVTIHEVFASDSAPVREAKAATRARFEAMLEAFAEGRVEAALAIASELRDACPEDGPAAWWFMRLVKESSAGEDAVPSSRGIVRLEEK